MVSDIEKLLDHNYSQGYADLHLHTIYSDGEYTPERLVKEAVEKNFRAIAVTDHDTVEGVPYVLQQAKDKIEVIPGVEISANAQPSPSEPVEEIHIVGLFIDYNNPDLVNTLKKMSAGRKERMQEMLKRLNEMGMPVTMEEVQEFSTKDILGRLHLAQAMVKKGYAQNTKEIFDKFLGNDKPAYVSRKRLITKEALTLIKQAGGVSIIAHPHLIKNQNIVSKLIQEGANGIEIYHPNFGEKPSPKYIEIAKEHNLLISGGSDCHGVTKDKIFLGQVKIPYQAVEEMKKWREEKNQKLKGKSQK